MGLLLLLTLAVHVGAVVAISLGLARREPRWHAAVAIFVPPLGAWWSLRAGMHVRVWVWLGSAALYAVTLGILKA